MDPVFIGEDSLQHHGQVPRAAAMAMTIKASHRSTTHERSGAGQQIVTPILHSPLHPHQR
jgi:hypothetical protein